MPKHKNCLSCGWEYLAYSKTAEEHCPICHSSKVEPKSKTAQDLIVESSRGYSRFYDCECGMRILHAVIRGHKQGRDHQYYLFNCRNKKEAYSVWKNEKLEKLKQLNTRV